MKKIVFLIIVILSFSGCESNQCHNECCNKSSNNLLYLIQSRDELQVKLHYNNEEFNRIVTKYNNLLKLSNEKYIDSVNLYEPGSIKFNYYDSIITSSIIKNNTILDYYYDSLIYQPNVKITCIENKIYNLNQKIKNKKLN